MTDMAKVRVLLCALAGWLACVALALAAADADAGGAADAALDAHGDAEEGGAMGLVVGRGDDVAHVAAVREAAPGAPQDLVAGDDDSRLVADDEQITRMDMQRIELEKRLGEVAATEEKMKKKLDLLNKVRKLQSELSSIEHDVEGGKDVLDRQNDDIEERRKKLKLIEEERVAIAEERKKREAKIEGLKKLAPKYESEMTSLKQKSNEIDEERRKLETQNADLEKQHQKLAAEFKNRGFELLLEANVENFPAVVKATIVKGSHAFAPLFGGLEDVAEFNTKLTESVTDRITEYIPGVSKSPFYTGVLFYILLLCPMVAATWLVLKIRARLSMLTVAHYVVAINLYFSMMSVLCFFMSAIGRTDILIVFLHRSHALADTFMILHGLLFVIHLVLHGLTAYVSGATKDFVQYIAMSCVGLHFFTHAYKRSILNQDPNIGPPAYFLYAVVFLYTLYDRGLHIVEAAISDRKAAAYTAFASPSYRLDSNGTYTRAGPRGVDRTIYFAGLPMFSSDSNKNLADAKTI